MKLLVASSVDPNALEVLSGEHQIIDARGCSSQQLSALIEDCEAVVFRSGVQLTADVLRRAPRLRLLIRAGSGCDNIDLNYVREHHLQFVRIPEPGARAVAELAFALMLSLARQVREADRLLRGGHWAKNDLDGYLLRDKTLGIIGCGNIGTCVGEMGVAWGMRAQGCVAAPSDAVAQSLAERGVQLADFDEVLRTSDFISIHVPLEDSTRNLLDREALRRIKPGAFLVNLSRGGVVDEVALYEQLIEGRLRGAGLDVHQREGNGQISCLASLSQVLLTPHIGASTIDTQREIGQRIIELVRSHAEEAPEASPIEGLDDDTNDTGPPDLATAESQPTGRGGEYRATHVEPRRA